LRSLRGVVEKGRRRIGKSPVVEEFAKGKEFLSFSGIAPIKRITAQDQRNAFTPQLTTLFPLSALSFTDWSNAFASLSRHLTQKPSLILFDEISWMASKDPTFTPKLKVW